MPMNMDTVALHDRWWADQYDVFETETKDVEFLLSLIEGKGRLRIFEMACGTGRILLPLVRAGHDVTGVEYNPLVLSRLFAKASPGEAFTVRYGDAFSCDWGENYDLVVLAGNILINLEGIPDYKLAQRQLIKKAADALRPGGYLFMDGDLHADPGPFFRRYSGHPSQRGTDSYGVSLTTIGLEAGYDEETQIAYGSSLRRLTLPDGSVQEFVSSSHKHIPTREQMEGWIRESGLIIEGAWGTYARDPISDATWRATYWAGR